MHISLFHSKYLAEFVIGCLFDELCICFRWEVSEVVSLSFFCTGSATCSPEHGLLHSKCLRHCWPAPASRSGSRPQPQPRTPFSSGKLAASLERQPSAFSLSYCSLLTFTGFCLSKTENSCVNKWKNKLQCLYHTPLLHYQSMQVGRVRGSAGKFRLVCRLLGALLCAGQALKRRLVFELHEFWKTEHRHCSQQFELQDIELWDIELPLTDTCWELTNDFLLSEILHINNLLVFFWKYICSASEPQLSVLNIQAVCKTLFGWFLNMPSLYLII